MADRRTSRSSTYEKQIHELQTQVKFLEEEVGAPPPPPDQRPPPGQLLEEKLVETRERARARHRVRTRSSPTPCATRSEQIEALAEEVEKLSQPPPRSACSSASNEDGSIDVFTAGRKMRVIAGARPRRRQARAPARR